MKPEKNKTVVKNRKKSDSIPAYFDLNSLILLIYAIVPVLTPNLGALDSTVSKFMVLAIINLMVFLYFLFGKKTTDVQRDHQVFFLNPIGIAYSVFLLITLFSFTQAINLKESVIHLSQIFSVFYCVIVIMMILKKDKKYLEQIAVVLSLLLFLDCMTVIYNVGQFINDKIGGIEEITSIYSNKNILSSAIFVKLPFVLWLQMYGQKKWRFISSILLSVAFLSIFLLSSRAFYLGIGVFIVLYLSFRSYLLIKDRTKENLVNLFRIPIILVVSILLTIMIQFLFFPDKKSIYTVNIADRLSTIEASESSVQHRLETWKIAGDFIRDNPLLGLGAGNWKIAEIEYEGPTKADYKNYMIHTHNDFLEVTAETGIPGGIFYLFLFILPIIYFLNTIRKPGHPNDQSYLFLSAFGIFCYSVDAMFNFPMGRLEIQILFAIFIGSAAWYNPFFNPAKFLSEKYGRIIVILTGIMTIPALFFLYQSFASARIQRIAQEELLMKKFTHNSIFMLSAFPSIPDISVIGEPISVIKSRYLIEDGRFEEAIQLLTNDKSSPFDGRQELMIIAAYERLGKMDSVLHYIRKMMQKKPLYYEMVAKTCYLEMKNGNDSIAIQTMQQYLSKVDTNVSAWSYYSYLFEQSGNLLRSKEVVDSALAFFPENSALINRKTHLENELQKLK